MIYQRNIKSKDFERIDISVALDYSLLGGQVDRLRLRLDAVGRG